MNFILRKSLVRHGIRLTRSHRPLKLLGISYAKLCTQALPDTLFLHLSHMPRRLSLLALIAASFWFLISAGCTTDTKQNPEKIREKTAEATAELKQDTNAVAQGIRDGLHRDKLVDLNRATRDQILILPGITSQQADRIIAERPYKDAHQLVTRGILSEQQFADIKDRVVVKE